MYVSTESLPVTDGYEQEHQANVLTCHCNDGGEGDIFYVFWPQGLDHNHVACAQCSQHYCLFNRCQLPQNPPLPEEFR